MSKHEIFLSWSGMRSRSVAGALHDWIPNVIQAIQPWMSATDIDKGARWAVDVAVELEQSQFGIICITANNLEAPWVLFEAGALSKIVDNAYVCPYLLDVEPSDLKGPLVQFQAAKADKEDTRKLVHTINRALNELALPENKIDKAFEVWWPELDSQLRNIPQTELEKKPSRSEKDMLAEVLDLVRAQARGDIKNDLEQVKEDLNELMRQQATAFKRQWRKQIRKIKELEHTASRIDSYIEAEETTGTKTQETEDIIRELEKAVDQMLDADSPYSLDPQLQKRLLALRTRVLLARAKRDGKLTEKGH